MALENFGFFGAVALARSSLVCIDGNWIFYMNTQRYSPSSLSSISCHDEITE